MAPPDLNYSAFEVDGPLWPPHPNMGSGSRCPWVPNTHFKLLVEELVSLTHAAEHCAGC